MLRSPAAVATRVTWETLQSKPSVFVPAPHTHSWSDLTGVPTIFPPAAHTHAWGDITGKPTSYPPSAHTHLWAEVTDKPAAFPPSAHTHSYNDLTDRPTIPAATPLASTAGLADTANGTVGTAASVARADHTHPLPAGRLQFIGNVTVNKTLLLALGSGMTREDFTLNGVTTADQGKLVFSTITPCAAGCEAINLYAKAANVVTLSYNTPALGIGAVINIPIAVYRIT